MNEIKEISKIKIENQEYDIKDSWLREQIKLFIGETNNSNLDESKDDSSK